VGPGSGQNGCPGSGRFSAKVSITLDRGLSALSVNNWGKIRGFDGYDLGVVTSTSVCIRKERETVPSVSKAYLNGWKLRYLYVDVGQPELAGLSGT
jgi:hypothetical protein